MSTTQDIIRQHQRDQRWREQLIAADLALTPQINDAYKQRCEDLYFTAYPKEANYYRNDFYLFWRERENTAPILAGIGDPVPAEVLALVGHQIDPLPDVVPPDYDKLRVTCKALARRELKYTWQAMPIHLLSESLHRACKAAKPFAALTNNKYLPEVLQMIHLESVGGDRLQLTTSNLSAGYRTTIAYKGHPVNLCVSVRNLTDYAELNTDGARVIQHDNTLTLIFPDNRATFRGIAGSEFPNPKAHSSDDLIGVISDSIGFKTTLTRLIAAGSTAKANRIQNDAYSLIEFATNDTTLGLRASDGTQLATGNIPIERDSRLGFQRILLHRDGLAALLKALPKEFTPIQFYANDSTVYFVIEDENAEIILQRTPGELPLLRDIFPESWTSEIVTDLDYLIANVKQIKPYCSDHTPVTLSTDTLQLNLNVNSPEKGENTVWTLLSKANRGETFTWQLDNAKLYKALAEFAKVGKKPTRKTNKKGEVTITGDPRLVTIKSTADQTVLESGDQLILIMNMHKD